MSAWDGFVSVSEAMRQGSGQVTLRGWVYRERGSAKVKFVVLRDSSGIVQCVFERSRFENEWDVLDKLQIESSLYVRGEIKEDKRAPSGFEVRAEEFLLVGAADKFPIQKDQSPEFLLDNRHLWLRSRKMTAVLKVRSAYIQARDAFFRKEGFFRFDSPILQPNQCEGGSTLFEVKYYKTKTYLAQTWQLYAEAGIFGLERIYNMGPTFRAEKSKTSRHLSEFWMGECEAAWWRLADAVAFAKKELKFCIEEVAKQCPEALRFLGRDPDELVRIARKEWPTITYREALRLLKEKAGLDVPFGKDLRTVEEDKLMEFFDTPVAVTHYPVEIMAFYKPPDPERPDEALCFDMLAPEGYGEIVGGSERSNDVEDMKRRLERDGEDVTHYEWYFDLRRFGAVPHAGYGVGTERVVSWLCKLETIKDAIPFPRTMLRWTP
ncbi:asparagine--tRNA ligase [Candidatus Woesearchaeota archaeon]|nr:MAG: asparagine--tRNA ligase [Candidatus Woesearchaeota archaeon]